jgi:hypothetical protein
MFVFLLTLTIYSLSLNGVWATDHATSFVQLDYAIWKNHSFALGKVGEFQPNSVDDFQFKGEYYSALAPGTAVLALPFAVLGFLLDGHYSVFGNTLILTELFVALTNSICSYFVYKISKFYFAKQTSLFLGFVFAFSTVSWPFATYFFQSDVSAMFDVIMAYFALKIAQTGEKDLRNTLYCGLAAAAALTVDYVNAILIPIVLFFLIFSLRKYRPRLLKVSLVFLVASCLGIALIAIYNMTLFGQPLATSEQLYLKSSTPFGNFTFPFYLGLVLNLFTPLRGLFFYTPFLVVGVLGYHDMLRSKSTRGEGLFLLGLFLGILLPYSAWYAPTGGVSFGPRFIIPAIPYLIIPAGFVLSVNGLKRFAVTALYAAGVLINGFAALTSILAPDQVWGESPFLNTILPNFLRGKLDVWWIGAAGPYWIFPAIMLIVAAIAIPANLFQSIQRVQRQSEGAKKVLSHPVCAC